MSYDFGYHDRLRLLAELMKAHPKSKMKSLQKAALRAFPVDSKELHRHCMSFRFALKAAAIVNEPIIKDWEAKEAKA